ncbi:MAG: hypothetical protein WKG07_21505 [Hymenobacter sp.]
MPGATTPPAPYPPPWPWRWAATGWRLLSRGPRAAPAARPRCACGCPARRPCARPLRPPLRRALGTVRLVSLPADSASVLPGAGRRSLA